MASAAPEIPELRAIHPAYRPIISTTMTRRCDSAVACRRSRQSVAKETAVSKPNVITVPSRSLSMVLGTPTTRRPLRANPLAMVSEPSPPMAMRASICSRRKAAITSSERSRSTSDPSSTRVGYFRGLPTFVVPRMVPPRWVMPRTTSRVSGISPPCGYCSGRKSPL